MKLVVSEKRCFLLLPLLLTLLSCASSSDAKAETAPPEADGPKWGAEDQKGALNRVGPSEIVNAASLIKEGRVYDLGRVYESGMPLFGGRHFKLTLSGGPTGGPMGTHNLVYHDEMVSGELGQIGTQLDGLGHIAIREDGEDLFYNGLKASEIRRPYGLEKLGIENFRHLFTRGVLIDVARSKGVERLAPDYIITVPDLKTALKAQGTEIRPADIVLIRTGHGKLWMKDNDTYGASEPGPGITAIKWLIDQEIVLLGADNWGVEAVPGENQDRPFEGHQWLLQRNGIYNLENLQLKELSEDQVYEFAFFFAPLALKGATGSPGNPVAIR